MLTSIPTASLAGRIAKQTGRAAEKVEAMMVRLCMKVGEAEGLQ